MCSDVLWGFIVVLAGVLVVFGVKQFYTSYLQGVFGGALCRTVDGRYINELHFLLLLLL